MLLEVHSPFISNWLQCIVCALTDRVFIGHSNGPFFSFLALCKGTVLTLHLCFAFCAVAQQLPQGWGISHRPSARLPAGASVF